MTHEKDSPDILPITLGNPTVFPRGLIVLNKLGDDICNEGFKLLIPAVFLSIQHTVAMHDPAHISRLMRTEKIRNLSLRRGVEHRLNRSHRVNDAALIIDGQRIKQRLDTMLRAGIEQGESLLADLR